MNDLLTLERLAGLSRRDKNLTTFAREEFQKLIKRFPEDGFEIELPVHIPVGQENALRLLEQNGYIKSTFGHHGADGFSYRIDLRGKKFYAPPEQVKAYRIADNKTGEIAEWDLTILPIELHDLQTSGFDLHSLAFNDRELNKLLKAELPTKNTGNGFYRLRKSYCVFLNRPVHSFSTSKRTLLTENVPVM